MRLRTLALALALSTGLTGLAEAKKRPPVTRPAVRRTKVAKSTRKAARKVVKRNTKGRKVIVKKRKAAKA
jgi:hypothetical protein